MPTKTERALVARRRAAETGTLLVPILERLLESPVEPEDDLDFRYMDMLLRARALPRRKGVFSPSMLASCRRQVYLAKRGEEKLLSPDPQMNGYFLTGNFTHFKWQFALWRAHRAGLLELARTPIAHEVEILEGMFCSGDQDHDVRAFVEYRDALDLYGDGTRPGVEVRVVDGDLGGTIDALVHLSRDASRSTHVVDFKGVRLDDFMKTVRSGAKKEYRQQIVGYAILANKVLGLDPPVERCLLVSECKAGPVAGMSPIGLHEALVPVAEYEGEVRRGLRTLRFYDAKNRMPAAECVSTRHQQFQSCPFHERCREEVSATQREREARARESNATKNTRVARSRRNDA